MTQWAGRHPVRETLVITQGAAGLVALAVCHAPGPLAVLIPARAGPGMLGPGAIRQAINAIAKMAAKITTYATARRWPGIGQIVSRIQPRLRLRAGDPAAALTRGAEWRR